MKSRLSFGCNFRLSARNIGPYCQSVLFFRDSMNAYPMPAFFSLNIDIRYSPFEFSDLAALARIAKIYLNRPTHPKSFIIKHIRT